jgi:hypothetical protein
MKVLKNNLVKYDIFVIPGYGPFIFIRPSKYGLIMVLYEMIKYQLDITLYEKISLSPDLSVKRGTSERCYRTRRGRTDEQRYAIISPYFDGQNKSMKRLFRCHLGLFWLLTGYFGYSYHRGTLVRSFFFSSFFFLHLFHLSFQ